MVKEGLCGVGFGKEFTLHGRVRMDGCWFVVKYGRETGAALTKTLFGKINNDFYKTYLYFNLRLLRGK